MNATSESESSKQDELNVVSSIEKKYVNKQVVQSQLEHAISNERKITTGFVNASSVVPSRAGNRSIEHKYLCLFGAIPPRLSPLHSLVSIIHPSAAPHISIYGTPNPSRTNPWFLQSRPKLLTANRDIRSSFRHAAVNIMKPDSRYRNTPDPIATHQSRLLQQHNFDAFLQTLESRFNATPEFTINHRPHRESGLGNVIRGVMTTVFVASVTERSFHSTRFDDD